MKMTKREHYDSEETDGKRYQPPALVRRLQRDIQPNSPGTDRIAGMKQGMVLIDIINALLHAYSPLADDMDEDKDTKYVLPGGKEEALSEQARVVWKQSSSVTESTPLLTKTGMD
jgi:hypothetical protein